MAPTATRCLHPVTAHLLNTLIVAEGGVVRSPDKLGKEIRLDVTVDKGRLEDLLRLAVKGDRPPMTGAINFHTKFDLPHGPGDLADRLNLNGKFDVERAQFTSPEVTAKIETLSRKGQGQPENKDAGSSVSQLKGNFVLDNGVITFRGLLLLSPELRWLWTVPMVWRRKTSNFTASCGCRPSSRRP